MSSNWRSAETAQLYLNRHKIPVIWDIDTRALVRHLRNVRRAARHRGHRRHSRGPVRASKRNSCPRMAGQELASRVTCNKTLQVGHRFDRSGDFAVDRADGRSPARTPRRGKFRVVAYDYGIKQNILRLLVDHHCEVAVVPAQTSAEDVLAQRPDGVFLSNGPGDPEPATYAIESIRKLLGRVPVFGICLGHQLCGLALGGKTFKLKFGHHGSNHPVKNLLTEQVEITAQNHGFCVDPESLPSSDVEMTHLNLNDNTNEGLRHRSLPLFSVQYHPEASPGPHDSHYLFGQFTDLMKEFAAPGSSRR